MLRKPGRNCLPASRTPPRLHSSTLGVGRQSCAWCTSTASQSCAEQLLELSGAHVSAGPCCVGMKDLTSLPPQRLCCAPRTCLSCWQGARVKRLDFRSMSCRSFFSSSHLLLEHWELRCNRLLFACSHDEHVLFVLAARLVSPPCKRR